MIRDFFKEPKKVCRLALVALLLVGLSGQVFAQGRGGSGFSSKNWGFSAEFLLQGSKIEIEQEGNSDKTIINTTAKGVRLKAGVLVDTRHFIYGYFVSETSGKLSVDTTKYMPAGDVTGNAMNFNQTAQQAGLGYQYFFGTVQTRSFNFYGGGEVGTISYSNTYKSSDLFSDEHTTGSNVGARAFFGMNFLLGAADLHVDLYYFYATAKKKPLTSQFNTHKYNELTSFSTPGLSAGLSHYF